MRKLLEKLRGSEDVCEPIGEGTDNKGAYNDVKQAYQDTGKSLLVLNKLSRSKWAKVNKDEAEMLAAVIMDLNRAHMKLKKSAVGLGVMAGR